MANGYSGAVIGSNGYTQEVIGGLIKARQDTHPAGRGTQLNFIGYSKSAVIHEPAPPDFYKSFNSAFPGTLSGAVQDPIYTTDGAPEGYVTLTWTDRPEAMGDADMDPEFVPPTESVQGE